MKVLKKLPSNNESNIINEVITVGAPKGYTSIPALPSNFLCYNTEELYVREFHAGELDELNKLLDKFNFNKFINIIEDLIQGVNINELAYPADLKSIVLFSSLQSTEPKSWKFEVTCPSCNTKMSHEIQYYELDFNELRMKTPVILPPELESTYPELVGISFDAFRVKHFKLKEYFMKNCSEDINESLLVITLISSLPTNTIEEIKEAYNFFYELDSKYLEVITTLSTQLSFDIRPINITCSNSRLYIDSKELSDEEVNTLNELSDEWIISNSKYYYSNDPKVKREQSKSIDEYNSKNSRIKSYSCKYRFTKEVNIDVRQYFPSLTKRTTPENIFISK